VVDVRRGDLHRVTADLLEEIDFVGKADGCEEREAERVAVLLQLPPVRVRHAAAGEEIVERLRDRLGATRCAVDEDVVREKLLPVGDEPVGIDDLELDRVGAGFGREAAEVDRSVQAVVGRSRFVDDEARRIVADRALPDGKAHARLAAVTPRSAPLKSADTAPITFSTSSSLMP
jgi:hypothetical protein